MKASHLRFDYEILRLGRLLTDQQLWCLGCDVRARRCDLKRLGWDYHPRPDKTKGCGRLIGTLPLGGQLSMWGFGFMATDTVHGTLWLDRKGFRPRLNPAADPRLPIFGMNDLPLFRTPETADQSHALLFLLAQLAERMEQHEQDILSTLGVEYRQRCLSKWQCKRTALEPEEVPKNWQKMARSLRKRGLHTEGGLHTQVA
ncbi:hypothetical protein P0Y35_10830 [Kiritimatiellaeota bacterium B1221]|nr:hypothetical protein [Kiritimatiellaeota bacterium B1221]